MITKFTVQGFKSLADFEIELGQVNVFIGANGSGKTNILEALGVLSAATRPTVDDEALLRRGVRLSAPGRYQTRLKANTTRPEIRLCARWEDETGWASYSAELTAPERPRASGWRCKDHLEDESGPLDRVEAERRLSDEGGPRPEAWTDGIARGLAAKGPVPLLVWSLRDYAVHAPTTPTLRGTVPDVQQRDAIGLSGGGLAMGVAALLAARDAEEDWGEHARRVLDEAESMVDWCSGVGVEENSVSLTHPGVPSTRPVLYFRDRHMPEEWQRVSAYEASEGVLYAMFAAVLAAHVPAPPLFAIDDFDHAMHPRLARALIAHFCEWMVDGPYDRQALLTSHNPLLLDGLDLQDDRIRLFAVDRTSTGRTVARRIKIDSDELRKGAKDGWTLSRLWATGELGGVPDVW